MLRRIATLLVTTAITFTCCAADAPGNARGDIALQTQLVALEKQSWIAWQARNGKFYETFLADDHVEVGPDGTATKDEVTKFVGSNACSVASWSVDHFQMKRFTDDTALLVYQAEQKSTCGGTAVPSPAWVSSLYVRRNGKWLNALYQQSATPPG